MAEMGTTANPAGPLRLMQVAERAFDQSDNIVVVLEPVSLGAPELHIIAANGAFCRAFGTTSEDVVGRTLPSLATADNDPTLAGAIADAVARRHSWRTEMRCRKADGGAFWFGLHLMPSVDPSTGQCQFVLLGRDITERIDAAVQQKRIQQFLAQVFLRVDAAVLVSTINGRILMNNPQFEQMFGYPPGGLVGRTTHDLVAPSAGAAVTRARRQAFASGQDYRIDVSGLRQDGSEVAVCVSSVVVPGKDMERLRIVTARERVIDRAAESFRIAGMIKLIALDEVKTALGPRWPEVEQRAIETAEHVIKRSLRAGETFSRTQDGGFVIAFAGRSEEEASFAAAMIGRRIRERLIGQGEDMAAFQVTAITTSIDGPETIGDLGAKVDLSGLLQRRLNARRQEIEARARRMLTEILEETRCAMAPVETRDRQRVVAYYAGIPGPALRTMLTAHGGLPAGEQASFDLDSAMLNLAADRVQEGLLSDPVSTVFVDVDFAVFQLRAAMQSFVETCRKLSPVLRQRLILVLNHLPPGIAGARLQECVQRLRPFCRDVAFAIDEARVAPSEPLLDHAPLIVIGADRVTGPGSAEGLGKLLATVHGKRGRLLARNVPDAPTVALLRLAGVDLLAMVEA